MNFKGIITKETLVPLGSAVVVIVAVASGSWFTAAKATTVLDAIEDNGTAIVRVENALTSQQQKLDDHIAFDWIRDDMGNWTQLFEARNRALDVPPASELRGGGG